MNIFSPAQRAVLEKAGRAISAEMDRRGILGFLIGDGNDDEWGEFLEVIAAAMPVLSPRDVCLFKGDWEARNRAMSERAETHVFQEPPPPDQTVIVLPVIRIERDGVDLGAQQCADGREDVAHLRRGVR